MSRYIPVLIFGLLLGAFFMAIVASANSVSTFPLRECAKTHNVYACEYVATPIGKSDAPHE